MPHRLLADAVLVLHGLFIAFALLGGLTALWRRRMAALHLPALAWGAYVMLSGRICPLTPLENRLRRAAGEAGYAGGFIEHYLAAAIYPAGLTRPVQVGLGAAFVACNLLIYAGVAWRLRRGRRRAGV
jgi:hypothetical protein